MISSGHVATNIPYVYIMCIQLGHALCIIVYMTKLPEITRSVEETDCFETWCRTCFKVRERDTIF